MEALTGVDIPISTLRDALATRLWTDVTPSIFYSRIYRNISREGELIGEIYVAENEYKQMQFDDTYFINVFFDPSDNIEDVNPDIQTTREVGIIFAVNVTKIYPSLAYRALEEIYRDVLSVMNETSGLQITPNEIVSGLDAYGDLSTGHLKEFNMHPWHTFRVNTTMKIDYDCSIVAQNIAAGTIYGFEYPLPIILTS